MERPLVGLALIVRKEESFCRKILLHKRKGTHAAGAWACPGGHMEMWESFEETAFRELHEEAGPIVVSLPQFLTAVNTRFYDEKKHYVNIFMLCDWREGEPKVMEPEKNDGWAWFAYHELPRPLMMGLDMIKENGLLRAVLE